jgi:hypothetical protein
LKAQSNVGYLPGISRQALARMADVGVLAEHAREIAPGKENSSAAAAAYKAWLFPEMRPRRGHHRLAANAARSNLAGLETHAAPARTQTAVLDFPAKSQNLLRHPDHSG